MIPKMSAKLVLAVIVWIVDCNVRREGGGGF
jgi:hypothetical protein